MTDKTATIKQLKDAVLKWRNERNWSKHHSPKNLAVSIAVEAAELLEHFQWDDYKNNYDKKEIERELADIIIYCLFFASTNKIDITKSVIEKLDYISKKYPVGIFNHNGGNLNKYYKIKKSYRKSK